MSEIVTIQAGNYANFIGTHWWNLQESSFCYDPNISSELDINHDILFREGHNYKGEVTFTPRLVLIDVKENLRSIRRECPLYRAPDIESNPLWDGEVDLVKQTAIKTNPFLENVVDTPSKCDSSESGENTDEASKPLSDFNASNTVWSDFLKTNLHPRSFCIIDEPTSEDRSPLEIYSSGDEIYLKSSKEMIENAIRRMTEECDNLQGFQLISDSYNGFSSVSNHVLQHLDDEYRRRSTLCFPTYQSNKIPPYLDSKEQMHRLYATLLSLNGMISYSSLFSPLSLSSDVIKLSEPFRKFPLLTYDANIQYQTSAILATAIDTITSQFRLKSMKFSLSDVTSAMSMYGRKLVCSSLSLPFPLPDDAFLNTMVQKDVSEYYMTSLSPFYDPQSEKTLYQSAVLRGVPKSKFFKPSKSCYPADPEEIFGEYLNKYSPSSVTTATVYYKECSVGHPFPKIFNHLEGTSRNLHASLYPDGGGVPVAASFSSSNSAASFIDSLLTEADKLRFKEYIKSAESSYEKDDYIEVLQNLIGLKDNYMDY